MPNNFVIGVVIFDFFILYTIDFFYPAHVFTLRHAKVYTFQSDIYLAEHQFETRICNPDNHHRVKKRKKF